MPGSAPRRPAATTITLATATGSASQQLLIPSAAPGTWYILVYGNSDVAGSSYSVAGRHASAGPDRRDAEQVGGREHGNPGGQRLRLRQYDDGATGRRRRTVYPAQQRFAGHVRPSFRHLRFDKRVAGQLRRSGDARRRGDRPVAGGLHGDGPRPGPPANESQSFPPRFWPPRPGNLLRACMPTRATWPCPRRCCCWNRRVPSDVPVFTLDPALRNPGYWTDSAPAGLFQHGSDPGQRHRCRACWSRANR